MKQSQIYTVMDLARRARQNHRKFNPLFVGPPGIGKSEIIQDWCKRNNLPFIDLRAAYLESPDLIGFPSVENVDGRQITIHNVPEFWPHDPDWEGVILLEEINRGTTSVMNTFMQMLTDGKIHKMVLPKKAILVGVINPENEHNDVNTMDTALKDRFAIFEVNYDKKAYVEFMKLNDYDPNVVMFIESNMWTFSKPEDVGEGVGNKYLSPRTFSMLNVALISQIPKEMELDIYESILGKNVGRAFFQFMNDEQPVLYKDIIKNPKQAFAKLAKFSDPADYKAGHISLTIKDIVDNHDISDDFLKDVLLHIPADNGPALISELEYKRKDKTLLDRMTKNYPEIKKYFRDVLNK
jgi:hypothetical protein